jgi:hypothetical protein
MSAGANFNGIQRIWLPVIELAKIVECKPVQATNVTNWISNERDLALKVFMSVDIELGAENAPTEKRPSQLHKMDLPALIHLW